MTKCLGLAEQGRLFGRNRIVNIDQEAAISPGYAIVHRKGWAVGRQSRLPRKYGRRAIGRSCHNPSNSQSAVRCQHGFPSSHPLQSQRSCRFSVFPIQHRLPFSLHLLCDRITSLQAAFRAPSIWPETLHIFYLSIQKYSTYRAVHRHH